MTTAPAFTRPYRLLFEHRPGYLYVYVGSDATSYEIAKQYWFEILAMLHRRRYNRVLIDKDISQQLAAHDVYTLVSELAHSGCAGVRFAIVDRYFDEERNRFEETVGANRGLNVRIVSDPRVAHNWLLNTPTSDRPPRGYTPALHARHH